MSLSFRLERSRMEDWALNGRSFRYLGNTPDVQFLNVVQMVFVWLIWPSHLQGDDLVSFAVVLHEDVPTLLAGVVNPLAQCDSFS